MELQCSGCRRVVSLSNADAGASKCPSCGAPLNGKAAPLLELDALLADVLREARELNKTPPAVSEPAAAPRIAPPGVFPKPSRSFYDRRLNWAPTLAVALGALLIIAAGYLAIHYIRRGIQNQNAAAALTRAEPELAPLKATLRQADEHRTAKDFASAESLYRNVSMRADALLKRLREEAGELDPGPMKEKVEALAAELLACFRKAQEALEAPEVKYGAQGLEEFEGQWVTPARKKELFEAKMKAEGRQLYNGEWLTEAEIHERKGEVQYGGRWISKAEYERLIAAGTSRPSDAPAPAPQPTRPERRPFRTTAAYNPAASSWTLDDFEKDTLDWANTGWPNANAATLSLEKLGDSRQLLITMQGGKHDKSAIVRRLNLDMSSRSKLAMDVFNATGEPVFIAIALETDRFYESRWKTLKTDANNGVTFDLRAGDYKSEATHWAHATRISNLDRVVWLYVLIYYNKTGKVYLDNIVALGGE